MHIIDGCCKRDYLVIDVFPYRNHRDSPVQRSIAEVYRRALKYSARAPPCVRLFPSLPLTIFSIATDSTLVSACKSRLSTSLGFLLLLLLCISYHVCQTRFLSWILSTAGRPSTAPANTRLYIILNKGICIVFPSRVVNHQSPCPTTTTFTTRARLFTHTHTHTFSWLFLFDTAYIYI